MKILLIDQFGEMGGAQRCLVEAAMGFAERGWELHALIPTEATQHSPLHRALHPYCVKIRSIPCGPFASGAKTASDAARLAWQLPREAWKIARTIAREQVDVIFVNGPRVLPAAALGRNGRPLIYHSHWMVPQRSAASLARTALRKSGASVIATSRLAAEWLQGSVEPHLVSTIYNGVAGFGISPRSPAGRRPAPQPCNSPTPQASNSSAVPQASNSLTAPKAFNSLIAPEPCSSSTVPQPCNSLTAQSGAGLRPAISGTDAARHIAILGRVSPEKGQLEFVRAARIALQRLPDQTPSLRFTVCGAPMFARDEYFEQVRSEAAGLPVEFPGWTEDIGAFLATVDLLVVPSRPIDNIPRVIVEAFAAGTPVLAFASGAIPELIRHQETGLLVQQRTPEALAEAILSAAGNSEQLNQIAARAHQAWQERYTLRRFQSEVSEAVEAASRRHHQRTPLASAGANARA
jgi:glycosyltransferase involved in cell wall biosynthesis